MAETKQGYAQEPFNIGLKQYDQGEHIELAYDSDYAKAAVDALFDAGLLADTKPGPVKEGIRKLTPPLPRPEESPVEDKPKASKKKA